MSQPVSKSAPVVAEHTMLERIGAGAYGEVWLARSITGTLRAVKVIRREQFDHERTFEREFSGLKKFEPLSRLHDGLVDILQIGRDDEAGYVYYVMELADRADEPKDVVATSPGSGFRPLTLAEVIRQKGRLTVRECARIGAGVAEALGFLHSHGLVHRDIKPSNIIFVGGRAKLADIGLVASLGDARSFVGTDGFIPPEGPGSPKADLYSLGKTLYELATGKNRLDFPDLPADLIHAPEAREFGELNETVLRACSNEPAGRHASAEDLRRELLLVDAGQSVRRLRRNERLAAVWRRIALVAAVFVLAGGAALWAERRRAETARQLAAKESLHRQEIEQRELVARNNLYAADMNLAQQAIAAGSFGRAESLLAAYVPRPNQPDMRGFEWFHFWHRVSGDSAATLPGHEHLVSSLALSRDGTRLFSASFDTTVREWSLPEGKELRRWTLPGSLFSAIALDPTDSYLAGEGGNRPFTSLLDLQTGNWVTNVADASSSIAFSPDGKRIVRGARAMLFDTDGEVEITDFRLQPERVLHESGGRVAFSADGKLLATGPWGERIRLWSWPELAPLGDFPGAGNVMALGFSPDGERLASVTRNGRLCLWDVPRRLLLSETTTHGGSVIWSVRFSPDGQRLVTGGSDQTVRSWDTATLTEQHVFRGHGSEVWTVLWSRDGRQIFSAGKDATIRVWNAEPPPEPPPISGLVQRPVFSPDQRLIAGRTRDDGGVVWETATGKVVLRMKDAAEVGGFSTDGKTVAILTREWSLQRRSLLSGDTLESRPLKVPGGNVTRRLVSPDGRWVVAGMRNGEVSVHDSNADATPFILAGHKEMIVALAVSPDGHQLLTGCIDRTARLWDLEGRKLLHVFEPHRMAVGSVAFSPDGSRIATGSWDDSVRVWDARSKRQLMSLGGHDGGVQAVAFAPDNLTLGSFTGTSVLKFWSLSAEREAGVIQLPPGFQQAWVNFSPGGEWAATVSQAGVLTLLRAPREKIR